MSRRTESLWLAIILIMFFLCLYSISRGQSQQFKIIRVCADDKCQECKGCSIAITKDFISIRNSIDTSSMVFNIVKEFKYKSSQFYKLEEYYYKGMFQICADNEVAYLEIMFSCCRKNETYYLKD